MTEANGLSGRQGCFVTVTLDLPPKSPMNIEQPLSPRLQKLTQNTLQQLQSAVRKYGNVAYSNSLGAEAMVLTDIVWSHVPEIDVFTLDTGRLHEETRGLLERLERRYQKRFQVYYPDATQIENYVRQNGINGFYLGSEERQSCCGIRKVEPFKRAIEGRAAWVTGVRREQSAERADGQAVSWDDRYSLWKISPLLDWSEADVWEYIRAKNLPYNPLHDQGYPSIGCEPCTRAVEAGADPRSGRWWWESADSRECGLQPRRRVIPIKVETTATARRAASGS
jgi:phosphoadenosine phosphosulfate reductase